jgi:serine/threonine-protein kinase HipA
MNSCPITYENCGDGERYSGKGLRLLSKNLKQLNDFPYTQEEQIQEARHLASKLSIQGVQPKLSVKFDAQKEQFVIVRQRGVYIFKLQNTLYPELPENEDLTMRLAKSVGIEIPFHGMVYCKDDSLSYFIKRFDRYGKGKKRAVEDFAQLSLRSRKTKYDSSMEKVAKVIEEFCTFPVLEKTKLLRLLLFCFLLGNEDMHLKNFSLIHRDDKIELSPAYDLLNSSIYMKDPEDLALPVMGEKRKLSREHLLDYFAIERLALSPKIVLGILEEIFEASKQWDGIVDSSFLSFSLKEKYLSEIQRKKSRLYV